jgi:hypothetical protein
MDPPILPHPLSMADLTILHAPSTLYLPEAKHETGLRFAFNGWSSRPAISTTPMVTVEMVDTVSSPSSPAMVQDFNLLSPPRRSSKSKDSRKVLRPTRPASAPPERPSKVRTIDPRDLLSRPNSPDTASGRRSPIPIVVRRPPTTLCMCIVS